MKVMDVTIFNRNETSSPQITLLNLLFHIILNDCSATLVILYCPQEGISLYQVSLGGCSSSSVSDIAAHKRSGSCSRK
jgi:hypothetical protein